MFSLFESPIVITVQ